MSRKDLLWPFGQYVDEELRKAWEERSEFEREVIKTKNPIGEKLVISHDDYRKAQDDFLAQLGKPIETLEEFQSMNRAIWAKATNRAPKEVGISPMLFVMWKMEWENASPKDRQKLLRSKPALKHGWRDRAQSAIGPINGRIMRLQQAKLVDLEAAQILEAEGVGHRTRAELRLIWDNAINQIWERAVAQLFREPIINPRPKNAHEWYQLLCQVDAPNLKVDEKTFEKWYQLSPLRLWRV